MAGDPCTTAYHNAVASEHPEAVEIDGWWATFVLDNMPDARWYCPNCGRVWLQRERGGFWISASGVPTREMICELARRFEGR